MLDNSAAKFSVMVTVTRHMLGAEIKKSWQDVDAISTFIKNQTLRACLHDNEELKTEKFVLFRKFDPLLAV